MRFGLARALDQALAQRIDRAKIGAHSFEHDLAIDVDHVPVANAVLVHDALICMREPSSPRCVCAQKILNLRLRQIFENDLRHVR